MSACITCKHLVPLYTNQEFVAARLLGKVEFLKMKCDNCKTIQHTFTVSISYIITPHSEHCSRYVEVNNEK